MPAGGSAMRRVALPIWLAGAAVLVLGIVTVAAAVYLIQSWDDEDTSTEVAATPAIAARTPDQSAARQRRRTPRCDECGIVESLRTVTVVDGVADSAAGSTVTTKSTSATSGLRPTLPVDGAVKPLRRLEIVIRLQDGSTRTITDVESARWKRGERVNVIAGSVP